MKTVIFMKNILIVLSFLAVFSCGKTKPEDDELGAIIFFSGDEVINDIYKGKLSNQFSYDYYSAPEGSILLGIQSKYGENGIGNEGWSPLDSKVCMEELTKELCSRVSSIDERYYQNAAIQSSLVYCDGMVQITCDKDLLDVSSGENVARFFVFKRPLSRCYRINSPNLVVVPLSEDEEAESADVFFREGDCIPQAFVFYPSSELEEELVNCTVSIEIPVQKELFHKLIKEHVSGNKDATLQYEKGTLHATIEY